MYFSYDGMLLLVTVILAIDYIDKVLATDALNKSYPLSVWAVLTIDKKTLNHYYSKTDHSDLYHWQYLVHSMKREKLGGL